MRDPDTGPLDLDVDALAPADFARLLVSRACTDTDRSTAWAEMCWDAARYQDLVDLTLHLVGFVEQLLAGIGEPQGLTSAQVWQRFMLNEATARIQP